MSFSYDPTLPNPPDDPADDVDQMQVNSQSISDLISVDHVGFNTAGGGEHDQVTFNNKNVPGAQTDPKSVLYTDSGTASTVSQLLYINQNATFPVSALRAFVNFTGTSGTGAQTINNSYNVSAVTKPTALTCTVTLSAATTNGNSVCVLYSQGSSTGSNVDYTFSAGVLTISRSSTLFPVSMSVNVAIFQY